MYYSHAEKKNMDTWEWVLFLKFSSESGSVYLLILMVIISYFKQNTPKINGLPGMHEIH